MRDTSTTEAEESQRRKQWFEGWEGGGGVWFWVSILRIGDLGRTISTYSDRKIIF